MVQVVDWSADGLVGVLLPQRHQLQDQEPGSEIKKAELLWEKEDAEKSQRFCESETDNERRHDQARISQSGNYQPPQRHDHDNWNEVQHPAKGRIRRDEGMSVSVL